MITKTIFTGCTLTAPDVALAYSNAWGDIADTSGTAARVTLTAAGVTVSHQLNGGAARFSLLPFVRASQSLTGNLFAAGASSFARTLSVTATAYSSAGVSLGATTYVQPVVFGAVGTGNQYTGDRYITYTPGSAAAVSVMLTSSATFTPSYAEFGVDVPADGVLQNVALSAIAPGTVPDEFTISASVRGVNAGQRITGALRLHVTTDRRTKNVVNFRWIDAAGCVNYRTFARGTVSQSVTTSGTYQAPVYNRGFVSGIDAGNNTWAQNTAARSLQFGDNAIAAEQYEWLCSLLAAGVVEMQVGNNWQRVNIGGSTFEHDTRKHVFNFSAAATLPALEGQQW